MINIYKDTDPVEDLSPKIEKRLDKISEISHATGFDWFDITDYNNTAQFTPDDWYQALNRRARMKEAVTKIKAGAFDFDPGFDLIFYGTLADPLGVPEADPLEVSEADPLEVSEADPLEVPEADPLEVSEADPLGVPEADPLEVSEADPLEVSEADPLGVPEAGPLEVPEADRLEVSDSTLIPHKSVRVAKYKEVCADEWSFGCKDLLLFPGDPSIAPSISKIKDEQDWDSRAQEGRNKQSVVLVADLSMSENKLLTEFKALIRAHKTSIKDQPKKMGVSDRDIEKYTDYQVLGYWDLTLFARLKGISLKNQEKADKLFPLASQSPNNIKDKGTIKDTIRPFAEKAISEGHLKILRGQL